MKRIRVSALAGRDLGDIWFYVATNSGSYEIADHLVESITETFPLFARAPEAGTRRDEVAPGLRGFPVGNYIVYYTATERNVVVARVLHGRRDQQFTYRTQT
jgi:toxin ParE1/3/4